MNLKQALRILEQSGRNLMKIYNLSYHQGAPLFPQNKPNGKLTELCHPFSRYTMPHTAPASKLCNFISLEKDSSCG